jgi:hypothetical protein
MKLSRWLQDRPYWLESVYRLAHWMVRAVAPVTRVLGTRPVEVAFEVGERVTKGWLFDCRMCGMCELHNTGMTCPMTCPKQMRNGPCGGVRPDGKCEVVPEVDCVWNLAWERSERMPTFGEGIHIIQPPVDWQLEGSSAWLNMLEGRDQVASADWIDSP